MRLHTPKRTPKTSILATILLITAQTALSVRFESGLIQHYPEGTPTPTDPEFVQETDPTSESSIQGTLKLHYKKHLFSEIGEVKFRIYFREQAQSTQESLILDFAVPFSLTTDYQNQKIVYLKNAENEGFRLSEDGIDINELEDTFKIFKGRDISDGVEFLSLETKIFVERHTTTKWTHSHDNPIKSVNFDAFLVDFDLYYLRNGVLHRMTIDTNSFDQSTFGDELVLVMFIIVAGTGGLILQNALINVFSESLKNRFEANNHLFLSVLGLGLVSPLYLALLFRFYTGFKGFLMVIGLIVFLVILQNLTALKHLSLLSGAASPSTLLNKRGFVLGLALGAVWALALPFWPKLIFDSYYWFGVAFLADLVVLYNKSCSLDRNWVILDSILMAFRGFLIQLVFFVLYVLAFNEAHGEYPDHIGGFFLKNLGFFAILCLISAAVGYSLKIVAFEQKEDGEGPLELARLEEGDNGYQRA